MGFSSVESPMFILHFLFISLSLQAAIYGPDNRLDINQILRLAPIAKSIAIAVPNNFLEKRRDNFYAMKDVSILGGSSEVYACMDERFARQPIIGNCTGFLVGKRHLITAGHCVLPNGIVNNDKKHPFCDAYSWYFDFNVNSQGKTSEGKIPPQNIYKCKRIIRAENLELPGSSPGTKFGNDFAVMELDRDVAPEFTQLKIANYKPKVSQPVYTIGHPSGLPAKYSGLSNVIKNNNPRYFEANLDTLGGNSGGPVFDVNNNVLGILVSGHPVDYYMIPSGCYRVNKCNANGSVCNEQSQFKDLQKSNYVQYIHTALPYLKK